MVSMVFNAQNVKFMREACWCCDSSKCKYPTGCVAVKNNDIVLRAWNELLPIDSRNPSENERDDAIHSEAALIAAAAMQGLALEGCQLYVTRFPCVTCARLIVKAGVAKLYYMNDLFVQGNVAMPVFDAHGVEVVQINEGDVWRRYNKNP